MCHMLWTSKHVSCACQCLYYFIYIMSKTEAHTLPYEEVHAVHAKVKGHEIKTSIVWAGSCQEH